MELFIFITCVCFVVFRRVEELLKRGTAEKLISYYAYFTKKFAFVWMKVRGYFVALGVFPWVFKVFVEFVGVSVSRGFCLFFV